MAPDIKAELASRKAEILAFLRKSATTTAAIQPAPRDGPMPLSPGQERMWFLDQLDPGNPAYNVSRVIRLTGPLDVTILERSFNELVRRHEILRTTFSVVDGRPLQVIAPSLTLKLRRFDLRELPASQREADALRLASEQVLRPFNLDRGSLLRTVLVRWDEMEHFLALALHHTITDGWSTNVLLREVSALYRAFADGLSSPLPELPIQYADYAVWQRERLQGEELQAQLAYWREQLSDSLPVLDLPTDHPRPPMPTYRGARESLHLSKSLTQALKTLSARENATLFMTLLAAFSALLHRYSGQEDIMIGAPISGRELVEVEGMIGFFLNTLVLRMDLSEAPSFRELLLRVRQTVMGAFAHQDFPFEQLLSELHPERSLSHTPLFQVLLVLRDPAVGRLKFPEITASTVAGASAEDSTSQSDLVLEAIDTERGLVLAFRYSTDLFEPATIARMLGHLETLLTSIVADADQPISRVPMLTSPERQQLLVDWNNTEVDFPTHRCFHELFEEQVERTPERVAVRCAGTQLSYRELNRRANRMARVLVEKGVDPDVVVAVLDERGIDLMTALIGILKAGGSYLPLDPRHPAQRHVQVLEQSDAALILANSESAPALSEALAQMGRAARPEVLALESLGEQGENAENLPLHCSPGDLAYVIYTSGSTGVPKGAMVEHRGMVNHLYAKITDLELTEADVVAQTAAQTFDISVWQYLAALLVGGQVCIFRDEVTYDPPRLIAHVAREQISILETVPSVLQLILDEVADRDPASLDLSKLRWLIPTGEALPPELCRRWLSHYPSIPLLNAYGPTECSDDVTHYPIYQPPAKTVVNMPIGRPIANMRMYVLDRQLQPVPIGVPGELCVGGIGVGRGYLNDSEQTAEVFLKNPFEEEPGARLYRTGDLVRYLPDGNIVFLGRLDFQVKIRGFRIELGEIEAVLSQVPAVYEVVVLVKEGTGGDKRLVAYMVVDQNQAPEVSELRSFLRARLPDYMLPSAFVMLEAMPLTPHGKVDRRALPDPDWSEHDFEHAFVPPRTGVEKALAGIWTEILGVERVGVLDNFFELGGHSLLAVQLVSYVRNSIQVELPLWTIFEAPTVAGLATAIETIQWTEGVQADRTSSGTGEREEGEL
jgi:amino acid adenylation domain-containing protein